MTEEAPQNPLKIVHPLWMPRGSVRAFLTLVILGSVWYLMYSQQIVHKDLQDAMLLVIGYYFAMRRGQSAEAEPVVERHPLWLPGGTIRVIILAGFLGISYILYREQRLFHGNEAMPLLVLSWGFFIGYYGKWIVLRWQDGLSRNSFFQAWGHIKALITIAMTVAYCIALVVDKEASLPAHSQQVFLGILGFYFGNR